MDQTFTRAQNRTYRRCEPGGNQTYTAPNTLNQTFAVPNRANQTYSVPRGDRTFTRPPAGSGQTFTRPCPPPGQTFTRPGAAAGQTFTRPNPALGQTYQRPGPALGQTYARPAGQTYTRSGGQTCSDESSSYLNYDTSQYMNQSPVPPVVFNSTYTLHGGGALGSALGAPGQSEAAAEPGGNCLIILDNGSRMAIPEHIGNKYEIFNEADFISITIRKRNFQGAQGANRTSTASDSKSQSVNPNNATGSEYQLNYNEPGSVMNQSAPPRIQGGNQCQHPPGEGTCKHCGKKKTTSTSCC